MRVRTTALATLGLLVLLGTTGCGSGGAGDNGVASADGSARSTASSSPGGGQDATTSVLRFARCMRANGVPNFADPTNKGGQFQLMLPQGVDPQTGKAAMDKCKQYLPDGGVVGKPDPQFLAQMRLYAKCMRAHGVPGFPDPDPNGGMMMDSNKIGMSPDSPTFKAADQACAGVRPSHGQVHAGPGGSAPGSNG